MSLVSSLVLNRWNILVEGVSDRPIIKGVFVSNCHELAGKVIVNGSLSESKDAFLAQFYNRTGLPYAVLVDADSGGRELYKELIRFGIPRARIIRLEEVFPGKGRDFELEDILSPEFYNQAVTEAYPSQPVDRPEGIKKRRTLYEERYKEAHGIGFNKLRIGEVVKKPTQPKTRG